MTETAKAVQIQFCISRPIFNTKIAPAQSPTSLCWLHPTRLNEDVLKTQEVFDAILKMAYSSDQEKRGKGYEKSLGFRQICTLVVE